MNIFDWETFLRQESQKAIAEYREKKSSGVEGCWRAIELAPELLESEWLGLPGASEEQIIAAETRLGITLPPSYRTFLKVTNGWLDFPDNLRLRSTEEIEWFCTENQEWIDDWTVVDISVSDDKYFVYNNDKIKRSMLVRGEYMQTALQISDEKDGTVALLNPKVIYQNEWEAWILSNHYAGAYRCRSFLDMWTTLGMTESWL